jgi:diazepam-binding inhibitor (GABA receptor modulating acyl-CoA-binding protein)
MSNLEDEFQHYSRAVKLISNRPPDEDLLVLYGLYKQSTIGDCNTNEPGFFEFTAKTKWNSWNSYKGKGKEESMNLYIQNAKNVIDNYS